MLLLYTAAINHNNFLFKGVQARNTVAPHLFIMCAETLAIINKQNKDNYIIKLFILVILNKSYHNMRMTLN